MQQFPDSTILSRRWHAMLNEAQELPSLLPPKEVGKCVLDANNQLFSGEHDQLRKALDTGAVRFHQGRIRGALPHVR